MEKANKKRKDDSEQVSILLKTRSGLHLCTNCLIRFQQCAKRSRLTVQELRKARAEIKRLKKEKSLVFKEVSFPFPHPLGSTITNRGGRYLT